MSHPLWEPLARDEDVAFNGGVGCQFAIASKPAPTGGAVTSRLRHVRLQLILRV